MRIRRLAVAGMMAATIAATTAAASGGAAFAKNTSTTTVSKGTTTTTTVHGSMGSTSTHQGAPNSNGDRATGPTPCKVTGPTHTC